MNKEETINFIVREVLPLVQVRCQGEAVVLQEQEGDSYFRFIGRSLAAQDREAWSVRLRWLPAHGGTGGGWCPASPNRLEVSIPYGRAKPSSQTIRENDGSYSVVTLIRAIMKFATLDRAWTSERDAEQDATNRYAEYIHSYATHVGIGVVQIPTETTSKKLVCGDVSFMVWSDRVTATLPAIKLLNVPEGSTSRLVFETGDPEDLKRVIPQILGA